MSNEMVSSANLNMFQRILKTQNKSEDAYKSKRHTVPVLSGDQPLNPFNEVQLLNHHSDIIKFLVKVDDQRCATAGDDKLIVIWDVQLGRKLHVLSGHSRPLTALTCFLSESDANGLRRKTISDGVRSGKPILISASSDKRICMWDANLGLCVKSLSDHGCTVRDVAFFTDEKLINLFCTSGKCLCLWSVNGDLVDMTERDEEDLNHLLVVRSDRLVCSTDSTLAVYAVDISHTQELKMNHVKDMTVHRESITCIVNVNDVSFASGSLDGAIILWSTQSLTRTKYLSKPSDYKGSCKLYPYSIQSMICIDDRFLVVAIGCGFSVFDVFSGNCIAGVASAHYSKILHLDFVFDGLLLATCSEDGSIRLWGNPMSFDNCAVGIEEENVDNSEEELQIFSKLDKFLGLKPEPSVSGREGDGRQHRSELLGECLGHTGPVQVCQGWTSEGFVSCGNDGCVIVWRDGVRQEMRRNEIIRDLLYGASDDFS